MNPLALITSGIQSYVASPLIIYPLIGELIT